MRDTSLVKPPELRTMKSVLDALDVAWGPGMNATKRKKYLQERGFQHKNAKSVSRCAHRWGSRHTLTRATLIHTTLQTHAALCFRATLTHATLTHAALTRAALLSRRPDSRRPDSRRLALAPH